MLRYLAAAAMWTALSASGGQLAPSDIASRFDESEVESIDTNIAIALDTLPDSWEQTWFSASNQANGLIRILRSFEFDSSPCREVEFVSRQDSFTYQQVINFCRDEDLFWYPLTSRLGKSRP